MKKFKGTEGNWKDNCGIDTIGYDDDLIQIIVFSEEVNSYQVAHVFGKTQEEVEANAKLVANSKEMLKFIQMHYKFLNLAEQRLAEEIIKKVIT